MPTLREIVVSYTGPQQLQMRSIFYFEAPSAQVAAQRAALAAVYTTMQSRFSNLYTWRVEPEGRLLDDTSGALVGSWSESTSLNGNFTGSGQPVPDASQVLLQWFTGEVVGRRFLRGRTFVPGLTTASMSGGNVSSAALGDISSGAAGLVASGTGFVIWHRPSGGTGGASRPVATSGVWNELAVQRGRRG